jgi:hypothetical protein
MSRTQLSSGIGRPDGEASLAEKTAKTAPLESVDKSASPAKAFMLMFLGLSSPQREANVATAISRSAEPAPTGRSSTETNTPPAAKVGGED